MRNRKLKYIVVGIIFVAFIFTGIYIMGKKTTIIELLSDMSPSKRNEYKEIKQKMQKIEIGMTREEVNEIMGSPKYVRRYDRFEVWYFPDYRSASEPSSCHFDINTGHVVYVVNDEYQIGTLNPKNYPFK